LTHSLLDLAYRHPIDVWVVFRDVPSVLTRSRFWRWLKPGFQHVEVWRETCGLWVRIDPTMEYVIPEIHEWSPAVLMNEALNPTIIRVRRSAPHGVIREPFHIGPLTCVEYAKALLGIRAFWVRTPDGPE
jgi:hypothetical protein